MDPVMCVLYCLRLLIFTLLLINTSPYGIVKHNTTELLRLKNVKIKRTKVRVMYYSNHTASLQLVLSDVIEKNPWTWFT